MIEKLKPIAINVVASLIAWGALTLAARRIGFDATVLMALAALVVDVTSEKK